MLSRVSPHFRLDSSPCRPWCSHHRRCTATLPSLARHTGFHSGSPSRKTHWGPVQFSISQNIRILGRLLSMTSQPPRGLGAAAPRNYTAPLFLSRHMHPHVSVATVHVCRVSSLLSIFGVFFASGAARACIFFARISVHGSPDPQFVSTSITKIDGSCSSPGVAGLHDCTASYVRSRSRHIFSASLGTPRADGARQVRLACAKPQTSREVDQDPEGGLTRQCNTRPSFLITITSRRYFPQ